MLYSLVIDIKDTEQQLKAKNYNYAVYSWFLETIQESDPELSEKLHNSSETLFTISPFFREKQDDLVKLRITMLNDKIYTTFIDSIIKNKKIKIDRKEFEIASIAFAQSSKSRYSKIDEIESLEYCGKSELEKITVKFISPTFFKKDKTHIVIPEPELIFKSIARKYNGAIEQEYDLEKIREISARIEIAYLNIKTKIMNLKKIDLIGFTGKVIFDLKRLSIEEKRTIYRLLRFAYYSGVGAKTSFGFGQIIN